MFYTIKKTALWIDKYTEDTTNNKENILENSIFSKILVKIIEIKRQIDLFTIKYTYL